MSLTPLSQRLATERYREKLNKRGLVAVSVIVPESRREDIQHQALLMRVEHEQGERHETE